MPTATVLLRRDKSQRDSDGVDRAPLQMRIRHRAHADASLSLRLRAPVDLWDSDRQRVRGRSREAANVNAALADAEAAARDAFFSFRPEGQPSLSRDLRFAVATTLRLEAKGVRPVLDDEPDALEDFARWVESNRLRGGASAWFRHRAGMRQFKTFLASRGYLEDVRSRSRR